MQSRPIKRQGYQIPHSLLSCLASKLCFLPGNGSAVCPVRSNGRTEATMATPRGAATSLSARPPAVPRRAADCRDGHGLVAAPAIPPTVSGSSLPASKSHGPKNVKPRPNRSPPVATSRCQRPQEGRPAPRVHQEREAVDEAEGPVGQLHARERPSRRRPERPQPRRPSLARRSRGATGVSPAAAAS